MDWDFKSWLRESATQIPKKLINYVVDNLSVYAKLIPDIHSLQWCYTANVFDRYSCFFSKNNF